MLLFQKVVFKYIYFQGPRELQTSSFSGCLYEAILDGKPVGLWNFLTNEGCDACKEGFVKYN